MDTFTVIKWVAIILVIIGAINWGLVGAFHYNLITTIIHSDIIVRVVYVLIGIAGLFEIYLLATDKKRRW